MIFTVDQSEGLLRAVGTNTNDCVCFTTVFRQNVVVTGSSASNPPEESAVLIVIFQAPPRPPGTPFD